MSCLHHTLAIPTLQGSSLVEANLVTRAFRPGKLNQARKARLLRDFRRLGCNKAVRSVTEVGSTTMRRAEGNGMG